MVSMLQWTRQGFKQENANMASQKPLPQPPSSAAPTSPEGDSQGRRACPNGRHPPAPPSICCTGLKVTLGIQRLCPDTSCNSRSLLTWSGGEASTQHCCQALPMSAAFPAFSCDATMSAAEMGGPDPPLGWHGTGLGLDTSCPPTLPCAEGT